MKKTRRYESKKTFSALLALLAAGGIVLAGCGGGGGGGSVSGSSNIGGNYTGAASAGDLAKFSFDGKRVIYSISGPVFGNETGSIGLSPKIPGFLYTDDDGNYYYFSKNLGVAEIELDNGKTAYVVGLKDVKTPTVNEVAGNSGKKYLYLEITSNEIGGALLTVNPDGTWTSDNGDETENGTWEIKDNYIVVKDNNGQVVANVIVKPGKSRSGVIVDLADGTGFGIGLEQKKLTTSDLTGTYNTYYYDPNSGIECFGTLKVSGGSASYQESWCSDGEPEKEELSISISLNQLCDGTTLDGVACADVSNGKKFEMFIDPVDGYFIAVNPVSGEEVIGSTQ